MKATSTEPIITICSSCGADSFGYSVKAAMSSRRCCDECKHTTNR